MSRKVPEIPLRKTSFGKTVRLHLRPGKPPGEEICKLTALQLEAAIGSLSGGNVSPEPVHTARTSIKKARALLQLAAPGLGSIRLRHVADLLRNASSKLAPLRDSEVQVQTLDLLAEAEGLAPEECATLRAGLIDIAKQSRINGARQIPRVIALLEEVHDSVPEWPLDHLEMKDLRRRVRRIYRRGRVTLDLCRESQDTELFHAFRKTVKQLWYALRITAHLWPDEARDLIHELGWLGELAGKERDDTLLETTLRHGPRNLASQQLLQALSRERPNLRLAVLTGASRLYDQRPKDFASAMKV
jgi:CHAD domain-containing protein